MEIYEEWLKLKKEKNKKKKIKINKMIKTPIKIKEKRFKVIVRNVYHRYKYIMGKYIV